MPVVLLGERTASTALDHVGIDNVKAAREAVRHLIDSGCRRIAAIGGSASASDATSYLRFKGYRHELIVRESSSPSLRRATPGTALTRH